MRAFFSYGAALVIVVIAAAWLGTGTLIHGGQGPGMGERPVVSLIEPKGGPIESTLKKTGLQTEPAHDSTEGDPRLSIAQRQAKSTGATAPVRSVEVKTFTAEAMPIIVPLRGQTKPKATVTAAAETSGTVAAVDVTKGEHVKTGDLLCTLDKGTRQAAVAQAEAGLAQANASQVQAQANFDTNAALRQKGLATSNSTRPLEVALTSAKASVTAAQAALDNAKAELARTEIHAKSDGVVAEPLATVGSMLSIGAPCATIVQLNPLLFTGMVPEAHIGLARLGLPATVKTVTGQTVEGKVSFIASVADSATRSFEVDIDLPNPGDTIRSGLTASANVNVGTAPAQLLPQSVLTLNDQGAMGIRAVKDSKVIFYPVTIVKDAPEGMYVTGLPNQVDVITVGQEFVADGDTVKAVTAAQETKAEKADGASQAQDTAKDNGAQS